MENSSEGQTIDLNEAQRNAVMSEEKLVLVLSGAGTGKTRVIVNRFLQLMKKGIEPYSIMCVTFSNKAAGEILNRLEQIGININNLWVGTFHKICLKILQVYGNLNKKTTIIDEIDVKKIGAQLAISEQLDTIRRVKSYSINKMSFTEEQAFYLYNKYLEENNLIDFDDILIKTIALLENDEETRQIISSNYKALLVDEYQDTSKVQNTLIKLLLKNDTFLFCVGDDDQSIYSWRGANIDNILGFLKEFEGSKVYLLEQNYRSTMPIINTSAALISGNKKRLNKTLWSTKEGDKVTICHCRNEGDFIAQEIKKIPEKYKIGILSRTVSFMRPIEDSLINNKIPYKVVGSIRFFERLEIKIALSYLKAVFKEETLAIEKIINFPKRGIGKKSIEQLLEILKAGDSLSEALIKIKREKLGESFAEWKKLIGNPADILKTILIESGSWSFFEESPDRLDNLKALMKKINRFSSIEDFLMNFFFLEEEDEHKISLMTIHAAKGLEFDIVFIPGLVEGNFPHFRSLQEGNIQEERRLAYVAFTRAKHKLFLSYSLQNQMRGRVFGPSRFLFNLPKEILEYKTIY